MLTIECPEGKLYPVSSTILNSVGLGLCNILFNNWFRIVIITIFEIIDVTDGGDYVYNEHIGFVIDNPNFNCWVMIYEGGVFATDTNNSDFNDLLLPDFIKNWAYDWIIDNETLLDNQIKDKKLERIKEKWGENFIKELNVDEATLLKTGKF